jgi:TolA-binding protein
MRIVFPLWGILLFLSIKSVAQQNPSYKERDRDYMEAVSYFEHGNFDAAYLAFTDLKKKDGVSPFLPDIDYYLTVLKVIRNEPDAGIAVREYLLHYPDSPYRDRVMVMAVDKAFASNRLKEAKRMIDEMEVYNLPAAERQRIRFYLAYIALKNGDLTKAKRLFKELKDDPLYGDQAKYYLGYIAYRKNNIVEAQRYFDQVKTKKSYNKNIPYYNADMYYRAGDFQKAVEEALKIYPRSSGKERSQLSKIIGSSYFNMKEYDKAIPYLLSYAGKKGKWNNKDYYEMGFAYYKTGNCARATDYFNKIINADNELAQNAYYHLAECYLKNGHKSRALNAYKRAAEMQYDKRIREDAWYNYIKLSYEIGNPYESLDSIVKEYLSEFPTSVHKNELKNLLISSYLTSRNYKQALEAMQRNRMTSRPEYQKVAFLYGLELFNDGKYNEALRMFDLSLKHGTDPDYRRRAVFWKAESYYRLHDFDRAALEYKSLESEADQLPYFEKKLFDYNLGYVYFKQKDYKNSARYFSRFVQNETDPKLLKDAYLRLGDSYFGSKKYWPAMEAYNRAIRMKGHDADYAFYRKAISYGFVGKNSAKIEELEKFLRFYPQSKWKDDALYQLGSAYLNSGKFDKAARIFDRLVKELPGSPYVPVALLKTGLAYYNAGNNDRAVTYFKKLIREHPKSPEAAEAADYLKSIYIDQNKVDEFLDFVKQIPGFNIETNRLENEIFSAAEQKYFEKDYSRARTALSAYLKRFPQGIFRDKAHYYLAKIYLKQNEPDNAYKHFEQLAGLPSNAHTVEALRYLALQSLKKQDDDSALRWLEKLRTQAASDDDLLFAVSNLMKIYSRKGNLEKAVQYARRVLDNPKHSAGMENEALLILAHDAVNRSDWQAAEEYYTRLSGQAKGEAAAEAMYYRALFLHRKGEYKKSNEWISRLSKKYPSYKEWSGKALILMARNMHATGDVFNATYILDNVIKRFDKYPGIVHEARELLKQIKDEQSKKNEDVPEVE